MASVCLYFQVHQPFRLRRYSVFDTDHHYFDDLRNAEICRRVTHKCYLPAGRALLNLLRQHEGRFKFALSLTGTCLDQLEAFAPEVLDLFRELVQTGWVEVLAETYHHSLASLYSEEEFRAQVGLHRARVEGLFGVTPRVFRNTELVYSDELAPMVSAMGYEAILTNGAEKLPPHQSPNSPFWPVRMRGGPKLLVRNDGLSDDIAYRFSDPTWSHHPLMADTFAGWIDHLNTLAAPNEARCVNLFMGLETFGERQWAETGIFEFLKYFPQAMLSAGNGRNDFATPAEIAERYGPSMELAAPTVTSWADSERDVSAWLGNAMQSNAMNELYRLEGAVKGANDVELLEDWRRLTSSDHFYYMSTKFWADGAVHQALSPYESPYDAYINYMNVLDNLTSRLTVEGRAGGRARMLRGSAGR